MRLKTEIKTRNVNSKTAEKKNSKLSQVVEVL